MKTTAVLLAVTFLLGACGAGEIVVYPTEQQLNPEQIKKALKSDDFRKKTAARKQLDKLQPADRLKLLEELLAEGNSPTRMLAIAELSKLPLDQIKPLLEPVAKNDPDEEVREMAGMILSPDEDEDESADDEPVEGEAAPPDTGQ